MSTHLEGDTDGGSLVDHLELAHEQATDSEALYHIRAALQLAYCEASRED